MTKTLGTALFLDRDGVINQERPGDYVKVCDEFVFLPHVLEALTILNRHFNRIFIVTNQRGIGKGVMTRKALDDIHAEMLQHITAAGGRIDKIYTCTDINEDSPNRKPNIGMALQAVKDFPEVVLSESIMVGNSLSDMQFGENAGMQTVLVGEKAVGGNYTREPDLFTFAQHL
ncbi:D-glycero-alpha-D-manno-heptose-1,7-bisphosphate 7-phosphatase [Bacteroidia bacterium]|nr:D-glycero-alpha-D-manno-heptose-1,7-bisphosphate 7-phosphatase [Bacteroidia bacterium]